MVPESGARGGTRGDFAEAVQQALHAAQVQAAVMLDEERVLLLDFRGNQALLPNMSRYAQDQIGPLLGEALRFLSLRTLLPDDPELKSAQALRQPLSAMLWQIALHVEPETPLPPFSGRERIRLQRWPDFRVLARRYDDFRLCSLLLKRACTPQEAAQLLGIEPDTAQRFFNAACFSGLASVEVEPPLPTDHTADALASPTPAPLSRGSGSLLAGMWRSMRARLRS